MNTFFIEYRDPLFSIIIFFVLVFVITFLSYWWGRYKREEDYRHLDKFLRQFRTLPSQVELSVLISKGDLSEKSWLLLAQSYAKSGDYEKSIEIYNELLLVADKKNYRDTMFLLGRTYFRAGFLERAKQVFLEILKTNPRTPQALTYLLLVYESMHEYKLALEILEPLQELSKPTEADSAYLHSLMIMHDATMPTEEKAKRLLGIYKQSNRLAYLVFEYLFRTKPHLAWENFDSSKSHLLVDVLWQVQKKDLDLDIIAKNGYLRELYTARGDVDLVTNSTIFEFDVLIHLKNKANATLAFEYICNDCKQIFPFGFNRCSNCHALESSIVEFSLTKDYHRDFSEENNSFQ